MEWTRSCYLSRWRLFRGSPVETPGGYIFAPKGAKHFPYPHFFGSRNWLQGVKGPDNDLGEVAGKQTYSRGSFDGIFPDAIVLGKAQCFAEGESPGEFSAFLVNGFPALCFLRPPDPPNPPPAPVEVDIRDRGTQLFFAQVSELFYSDPAAAQAMLGNYLGPDYVVLQVPNTASVFPGSIVAVGPGGTVVVVSGTANFQQLATQVLFAGGGPDDFGQFSTNTLWMAASNVIDGRIVAAGFDPTKPIVLVGHSYGGAVAALLAGRYRFARPDQTIKLLTFAMPKPGDARLAFLLSLTNQVHVANAGDPVPSLPPSGPELLPLGFVVPGVFVERWLKMQTAGGRMILDPDGTLRDSQGSTLTFAYLWDAALKAIDGDPLALIGNHTIAAYRARLAMIPP